MFYESYALDQLTKNQLARLLANKRGIEQFEYHYKPYDFNEKEYLTIPHLFSQKAGLLSKIRELACQNQYIHNNLIGMYVSGPTEISGGSSYRFESIDRKFTIRLVVFDRPQGEVLQDNMGVVLAPNIIYMIEDVQVCKDHVSGQKIGIKSNKWTKTRIYDLKSVLKRTR